MITSYLELVNFTSRTPVLDGYLVLEGYTNVNTDTSPWGCLYISAWSSELAIHNKKSFKYDQKDEPGQILPPVPLISEHDWISTTTMKGFSPRGE